eukprot:m.208460 g.208460  ORF g.208460 m.208460 type:complete len:88 (+) comp15042_c0_seq9:502-765(+)
MSLHQLLPHTNNWLWRLATQPMLLDMLSFHYGERVTLFSSQLAVKAQQGGTETPWHQDGERCRTVWIPLVCHMLHDFGCQITIPCIC